MDRSSIFGYIFMKCLGDSHTGRQLGTRINECKLAIRRRGPLSLVFAHAVDCYHRFKWNATEVVAMASTKLGTPSQTASTAMSIWTLNTKVCVPGSLTCAYNLTTAANLFLIMLNLTV
ncbi:unnamed protein product [Schistocephalus solidus]|uniref:Uncharacterized protein n=1 Tax=Schistocephalus solidus TaxID=70667 RepID=A0A183TJD0_SCHSO|nr:unnamed protein product [Schistocephalus solidus]